MADFIAATKRIVAEVSINPVWGWCVRHWGTSFLALSALALLLDALRRSVPYPSLPSSVLTALGILDGLVLLALTVAHGVWLVRAKLELWRSRRGGRL